VRARLSRSFLQDSNFSPDVNPYARPVCVQMKCTCSRRARSACRWSWSGRTRSGRS
jgi:hypothetical protein